MSGQSTERPRATRRAGADKRRPQILRAAARLFQRAGFHATTMDDVADAVKLNKATLYHHFPGGKTDLLYGINATALDELIDRLSAAPEDEDPVARIRRAVAVMLGMQADFPDETIVLHEETRWLKNVLSRPEHREIVRRNLAVRTFVGEILTAGVATGDFAPCDAAFVAAWIVSVAGSAYAMPAPGEGDPAEIHADLILGALRRSEG